MAVWATILLWKLIELAGSFRVSLVIELGDQQIFEHTWQFYDK